MKTGGMRNVWRPGIFLTTMDLWYVHLFWLLYPDWINSIFRPKPDVLDWVCTHFANKIEDVCMDLYHLSWEGNRSVNTSTATEIATLDSNQFVACQWRVWWKNSIFHERKLNLRPDVCVKFTSQSSGPQIRFHLSSAATFTGLEVLDIQTRSVLVVRSMKI